MELKGEGTITAKAELVGDVDYKTQNELPGNNTWELLPDLHELNPAEIQEAK